MDTPDNSKVEPGTSGDTAPGGSLSAPPSASPRTPLKQRPTQNILTDNKKKLVRDLMKDKPSKVARKWGVNPASISRFKSREDVQALIRREHEALAAITPEVTRFYHRVIARANELIETDGERDPKGRAIDAKIIGEGIKAGQIVGQSVGLFPSHLQIHNHFLSSDSPSLSPILAALLSHSVPTIDITPENAIGNTSKEE